MIKIITDKETWDEVLGKFPEELRDIYYSYKHFNLSCTVESGSAEAFYYEEEDRSFFYPYIINKIDGYDLNEDYYDIQTPYGYGGPIINQVNDKFMERAEGAFLSYCKERKIVCEFVRFHPLIENHRIFSKGIDVLENRKTVFVDLQQSIEELWTDSVSSKNRNVIRKAEKNGLIVKEIKDMKVFQDVYMSTMTRIGADDFYYFDDNYFDFMSMNSEYKILGVEYEDTIIAASIFMSFGEYFHYHLAGSLKEYQKFSPNNIMLYEAMKVGKALGHKFMFLGGGLSNSLEDPLFKFKAAFSKNICNFYIGKRIHDPVVYKTLIDEWERRNGKVSKMLLQYRY
ncbi:hypothetical protein CSC2_42480 [Clostridium zeae]|uniref:BioF2-like acetyltransferase domain-containing protein n=1 Tax=Clostridium zeae TaxID=2759022 RepID=A0ABQ1EFW8_9CLOT|nr:GNAT family N-acetyltransferase [Clostridium zeae]GFZ33722.1 hypothetical protein CSC2_42480 [Clostridium zeae]